MLFASGCSIAAPSLCVILRSLLAAFFMDSLRLSSALLHRALLAAAALHWACAFLFHHSLFQHRPLLPHPGPADGVRLRAHRHYPGDDAVECAVCLCEIEEGEEIAELRCDHLFHGECLGRWVGQRRRATCPLCRDDLAAPRRLFTHYGEEVVVFDFGSVGSGERSAWWLR